MPESHNHNRDLRELYRRHRRANPVSWFIAFAIAVVIVCAILLGYRVTEITSSDAPATTGRGTRPPAPAPSPAQR